MSANLSVRWCSAYLKIDVGSIALRNQARFTGARTLFVTGERAEESASRAKYATFEPHRTSTAKRHVDAWRPVHSWTEAEVWAIVERWKLNPHPAYRLGWGRLSCASCIFGSADQWASLRAVAPHQFEKIAAYEREFGVTIHRTRSVEEQADRGSAYEIDPALAALSQAEDWTEPALVGEWTLPLGAFGDLAGPC